MAHTLDVQAVLAQHLGDPTSSFSVGALGAIAEFHRDPDEPLVLDHRARLTIATGRGALAIGDCTDVVPFAYEIPGADGERRQHGVDFCLPADRARSATRRVLTELGADGNAVRAADRKAILFDIGLGAANIDFCIRTGDPALLETLRAALGRSVLDPANSVMGAILDADPHRIAISALARAEVYQAIGRTVTPEGPHTHVLPELLKSGRTHASDIPIPDGWLPCLSLYPASPLLAT